MAGPTKQKPPKAIQLFHQDCNLKLLPKVSASISSESRESYGVVPFAAGRGGSIAFEDALVCNHFDSSNVFRFEIQVT